MKSVPRTTVSNILITTPPLKNMSVLLARLESVPGRVTLSNRDTLTIARWCLLLVIPCRVCRLAMTRSVVVGRKTFLMIVEGTMDSNVFVPGMKFRTSNSIVVTTIGACACNPFLLARPSRLIPRGQVAAANLLTSEETVELVVLLVRLQCIRPCLRDAFRTLEVVRQMLRVLTMVITQVTKNGTKTP